MRHRQEHDLRSKKETWILACAVRVQGVHCPAKFKTIILSRSMKHGGRDEFPSRRTSGEYSRAPSPIGAALWRESEMEKIRDHNFDRAHRCGGDGRQTSCELNY